MNTTIQETECIVDASLKLELQLQGDDLSNAKGVLRSLAGADCAVAESDVAADATATHQNGFAEWLKICWATHAGIKLKPSILMFVVMSQVAKHIKANGEAYRELFTGTKGESGTTGGGQKPLVFVGYTLETLTMDVLVAALQKELAPLGVDTALFLPEFSDSTARTTEATAACFCEAMSTYFKYVLAKCGMSKVCVVGTADDWHKAAAACEQIGRVLFLGGDKLNDVARLMRMIWDSRSNPDALRRLIRVEQCGSGHDTLVGHLVTLYNLTADVEPSADGLPSAKINTLLDSASVTIEDEITDAVWRKRYGIISSQIDAAGYLDPQINRIVLREHVPLSIKRDAQKRLGSDAKLDNDAEYKKARQAGQPKPIGQAKPTGQTNQAKPTGQANQTEPIVQAAHVTNKDNQATKVAAQPAHRYVFVTGVPQIRDAMDAGVGTILVGRDDGFVDILAGETIAGGPNGKTMEAFHKLYTVTVSANGRSCTATRNDLKVPAESPSYVFTAKDIDYEMKHRGVCIGIKDNAQLIAEIDRSQRVAKDNGHLIKLLKVSPRHMNDDDKKLFAALVETPERITELQVADDLAKFLDEFTRTHLSDDGASATYVKNSHLPAAHPIN